MLKTSTILAVLTVVTGCAGDRVDSDQQALAGRYVLTCNAALDSGFSNRVAANGDALFHLHEANGFAVVGTSAPNAYATPGCLIAADVSVQWVSPVEQVALDATAANPPSSGDDDFFFDLQWGHDAVGAVEAWNAGVRGAGVRVAVLDTGFDLDHPDLAPNINYALSRDFTGQGLEYTLPDPFSHGTHTAGTVAAADNGFGTIGVAPDAELVLVKVLYDEGFGSFGDILAGVYYAVDADADIISMSLGGSFARREDRGPNRLMTAMTRAALYARQNGTTIIAAAGNDGLDLDHEADLVHVPSDIPTVLSISATAPVGWAVDPTVSLDNLASYSNYGQSHIAFAAPGGDFQFINDPRECQVGPIVRPCWVFDFVFSTGNNGWFWSVGTSMATPHAAGVAALLLSEDPSMTPADLERALQQRADDLGKPGNDDIYGMGRVATGY